MRLTRLKYLLPLLMALFISPIASAQTCEFIAREALAALSANCAETGRNQVCYGNDLVDLTAQPTVTDPVAFEAPGDMTEVRFIQRLTLQPLDVEANVWGISLLRIQANLPETLPGQNVTMLLFGDSQLETFDDGQVVYFRSGIGMPSCEDAPDGLLIQTPEGDAQATFELNEIKIAMGSTAYLTADAEDVFTFNLLEGEATLTVDDEAQTFEGGYFVTVPLDADLIPTGPPSEPEAIDWSQMPGGLMGLLATLPIDITDLINVPEGDLADDDATVEDAVPEEVIIPQTGNWTYTRGEVVSDCPGGMGELIGSSSPIVEEAFIDFGGVPFDLEAFLTQNATEPLPPGEFAYPQPNVYQWTMSEEGAEFLYELRFLSETEIEGQLYFNIAAEGIACEINVPFEVVLDE